MMKLFTKLFGTKKVSKVENKAVWEAPKKWEIIDEYGKTWGFAKDDVEMKKILHDHKGLGWYPLKTGAYRVWEKANH